MRDDWTFSDISSSILIRKAPTTVTKNGCLALLQSFCANTAKWGVCLSQKTNIVYVYKYFNSLIVVELKDQSVCMSGLVDADN